MIRVCTLGRFSLDLPGQIRHHDLSPNDASVRVLACLLSSHHRRMYRDQLLTILVTTPAEKGDRERLSNRLDRAVHTLRRMLEPTLAHPRDSRYVLLHHSLYELAPQATVWEDAEAFEMHMKPIMTDAHFLMHADEPWKAVEQLEQALTLYRGRYLPAFGEELSPVTVRRQHLQRLWTTGHLQLANWFLARQAFYKALDPLYRLLKADPTNEAACQRLLEALLALDRSHDAVAAYHTCAQALEQTYHIQPLAQTQTLYAEARRLVRATDSATRK